MRTQLTLMHGLTVQNLLNPPEESGGFRGAGNQCKVSFYSHLNVVIFIF